MRSTQRPTERARAAAETPKAAAAAATSELQQTIETRRRQRRPTNGIRLAVVHSSRVSRALHTRPVRVALQGLLFFCVALAPRAPAAAQGVTLRWEAPSGCATAEMVAAKLRELVGDESLTTASSVRVRAHVQIEALHAPRTTQGDRTGVRYRLQLWLTVGARHAHRSLHSQRCEELTDAAAWLIAVAVNPNISAPHSAGAEAAAAVAVATARAADTADHEALAAAKQEQSPPHEDRSPDGREHAQGSAPPAREPAKMRIKANAAKDVSAKPTRRPWSRAGHAGVAAGSFSGGPSGVQASLGAFGALSVGGSYTQARISGLLPRSVEVAPGASARFWSLQLDLSQCALWGDGRVRAGPCLSLGALRTSANTKGLSRAAEQAVWWATASAGLQLLWLLGHQLELSVAAGAGIPVSARPSFTVEGVSSATSAKAWSSDARIGLSFSSQ